MQKDDVIATPSLGIPSLVHFLGDDSQFSVISSHIAA
jgi:hypothetical protein